MARDWYGKCQWWQAQGPMWLPFREAGGLDQWGLSWELRPGAGGGCGRMLKPQTPQPSTFTFVFQAENSWWGLPPPLFQILISRISGLGPDQVPPSL